MKDGTRKPPWSRRKWNECVHVGTIQDTERLVHKEWSHGFLPSTIPFNSFARTGSVAHDPRCFKILQSNLHSNCRPLKSFLLRSKMNVLGSWAMPCCSCLSESFCNPPLRRAGGACRSLPAPPPAAGNWSAAGRRERALRRHLEAPRGSYSERGATRWNERVSAFFAK